MRKGDTRGFGTVSIATLRSLPQHVGATALVPHIPRRGQHSQAHRTALWGWRYKLQTSRIKCEIINTIQANYIYNPSSKTLLWLLLVDFCALYLRSTLDRNAEKSWLGPNPAAFSRRETVRFMILCRRFGINFGRYRHAFSIHKRDLVHIISFLLDHCKTKLTTKSKN